MRRAVTAFVAILMTSSLGSAFAQTRGGNAAAAKVKNPVVSSAASVTAGQGLYTKNCSFCHGPKGLGDGPLAPKDSKPASFSDDKWDYGGTDGELFAVIMNGTDPKTPMVGAKGRLTDNDVWTIINFVRTLGPKAAAH